MWQIYVPKDKQAEYSDLWIFNADFGEKMCGTLKFKQGKLC